MKETLKGFDRGFALSLSLGEELRSVIARLIPPIK